jgi:hypothetical protein
MWKTRWNGTSIITIIIIYEERWESMWEMSIQVVQYTQSKLEDIMIEGILQEVSQERPK